MNNQTNTIDNDTNESIIVTLREEIEMAIRWNRPSILFAIYSDSASRKIAQTKIVAELLKSDIDQIVYQVEYDLNNEFSSLIEQIKGTNTILSIDPLHSNTRESKVEKLISVLDSHKNRIIDSHTKMIIWLTYDESILFAHMAPDLWSSRHRVVELSSSTEKQRAVRNIDVDVDSETQEGLYNFNDPIYAIDAEVETYLGMAAVAWQMKDFEKAVEFVDDATKCANDTKNMTAVLDCLLAKHFLLRENGSEVESNLMINQINELKASVNNRFVNYASVVSNQTTESTQPAAILSEVLAQAKEFRKQGDLYNAVRVLVEYTKNTPDCDEVWYQLGNIYSDQNIIDKAVISYEKISNTYSDINLVNKKIAECYSVLGEFEKSIEIYKLIIRASKDENEVQAAWIKIGDIYRKMNGFENAIAAYSMADQAKPSDADNSSIRSSIDSSKLTADMWNEIGNIFVRTNDTVEAESAYIKAIELRSENAIAMGNLGILYSKMRQQDKAMNYLLKAIDLFEDSSDKCSLWNVVGDQYRTDGKYTEAITAYTTADELAKLSSNGKISINAGQLFSSISHSVR